MSYKAFRFADRVVRWLMVAVGLLFGYLAAMLVIAKVSPVGLLLMAMVVGILATVVIYTGYRFFFPWESAQWPDQMAEWSHNFGKVAISHLFNYVLAIVVSFAAILLYEFVRKLWG